MTSSSKIPPTVNSRLRVLVAKTYRAEKLYSSIRNNREDKVGTSPTRLFEVSNDIRAREWQKSHQELRTALNDILGVGSNSSILAELLRLRERFLARVEESTLEVEKGARAIVEASKRHEFAHVFRLSMELVREKARVQASKAICDELTAVLKSANKENEKAPLPSLSKGGSFENMLPPIFPQKKQVNNPHSFDAIANAEPAPSIPNSIRSNVIVLNRRVAGRR